MFKLNKFQKRLHFSKTFTLIELLVVITIIGLLASIVLVSVNNVQKKAKIARAKQEVSLLYETLLRYYIENNSWPNSSCNVDTLIQWNGGMLTDYINGSIPADPWGTAYFFERCPDTGCIPGDISLCSAGPNGVFESQNRADLTVQGDDICIYFEPTC